ncbi:hypothetical protein S58_35170 [Bradyrhizobium oligotrophicum S58]|uniref:Uncharacterized protein n=1 Tax=Bradyrhizobium oligotrophicum S58 TaxID=1245469 RepID=M4ZT89_9BRAD|nr:hypothetical protein [Bradyrhizobium oligotrophicum]BAM89510.1 hypothetical protein S58_35170 [Bradyrhizobium oligotrophicum S58]
MLGWRADERHLADVKSRGPGIPTLMPSWRVMMILLATVAKEPEHRGDREISVKTIAQGMPDVGWTCGDCRLLFFCRRAMGCGLQPGIPCALRWRRVDEISITRARRAARTILHDWTP